MRTPGSLLNRRAAKKYLIVGGSVIGLRMIIAHRFVDFVINGNGYVSMASQSLPTMALTFGIRWSWRCASLQLVLSGDYYPTTVKYVEYNSSRSSL